MAYESVKNATIELNHAYGHENISSTSALVTYIGCRGRKWRHRGAQFGAGVIAFHWEKQYSSWVRVSNLSSQTACTTDDDHNNNTRTHIQ